MKKQKQMPNVTVTVENMLEKANMNLSRENRKLEEALRRMSEALSQHAHNKGEHGIDSNVISLLSFLMTTARCVKNAQKANDEWEVALKLTAMVSVVMKDRPGLENYFGIGRWIEEWEREEGDSGFKNCTGMHERFLNVMTYPQQMRGAIEYILLNKR